VAKKDLGMATRKTTISATKCLLVSGWEVLALETVEEKLAALGFGEVFGDAGPDELAGGVVHEAADDEAFGSGLF
jgi:hypothetical protein